MQSDTAWFELYPSDPNTSTPFKGLAVAPGDSIRAAVFQRPDGAWETRVDDVTTGMVGVMVVGQGWGVFADSGADGPLDQGSTANLVFSGAYSAEWIVEDYGPGDAPIPFADYGTVTFTDLAMSVPGWTLDSFDAIGMVNKRGGLVSIPSSPGDDSFTVTYGGP